MLRCDPYFSPYFSLISPGEVFSWTVYDSNGLSGFEPILEREEMATLDEAQ
jgi:hypothetical protein